MPQCEPPVPHYEEPHYSQDQNPLELVNGLEPEKETNDPLCLVGLCRNLPKEYWLRTQGPPPRPLPPSP